MGSKPLDEEDVQHLNNYLERKTEARNKRKLEDDAEVEIFRRTREMRKGGVMDVGGEDASNAAGSDAKGGALTGKKAGNKGSAGVENEVKIKVKGLKKRKKVAKKEGVKKVEENNLFGAYGSDSDSN